MIYVIVDPVIQIISFMLLIVLNRWVMVERKTRKSRCCPRCNCLIPIWSYLAGHCLMVLVLSGGSVFDCTVLSLLYSKFYWHETPILWWLSCGIWRKFAGFQKGDSLVVLIIIFAYSNLLCFWLFLLREVFGSACHLPNTVFRKISKPAKNYRTLLLCLSSIWWMKLMPPLQVEEKNIKNHSLIKRSVSTIFGQWHRPSVYRM
jgi:hypothetical protein